ncbi:feather beta keratin-like [Mergus octosetaceus]|uniref:Keratin n=6 Tax=Anatidae TaxID=8830 RepID=U3HZ80_ANAPP|nr:beta-keratin-related protein [Anas platyrhynchos]XP_013026080.1 beta-keratin-related protein-like [Anser cygnoides]XP_032045591.1 beta-keratin-related protein-like [Aythya fuligula]XP_035167881.1 beta-keratin-related protein-like [Oxyura jamaicensis]XP_035426306.1 beta-keratin-related protein-like [Cygnus atratus]XP_040418206.1 beta-keratin-related protein-like [Cygnus olor]|eukprot:XP_012959816.1 beta-keratin-related protein [Anas platyrhynchos]
MSCYDLCLPSSCGPRPLATSCNEPCYRRCGDSTTVIQPPTVVVTLPGPILSSYPQNTVVGSTASAAVGSYLRCCGVPVASSGARGLGKAGLLCLGGGL